MHQQRRLILPMSMESYRPLRQNHLIRTQRQTFTVFGAAGFIGSHLCRHLYEQGHEVIALSRHDPLPNQPLGHVLYASGVTSDFRTRPLDVVESHVWKLAEAVHQGDFESFVYCSSTRVYMNAHATCEETPLPVQPNSIEDLYSISKLMGENIVLTSGLDRVHVARISNVYGPPFTSASFLDSAIRSARDSGQVHFYDAPNSSRDYIAIDDVVTLLPQISLTGRSSIYNIASGSNTSHREIARLLHDHFGATVEYRAQGVLKQFPPIEVARLATDFCFVARPFGPTLSNYLTLLLSHQAGVA
jgi:nucleoside-diphosphate-sugar epimerase